MKHSIRIGLLVVALLLGCAPATATALPERIIVFNENFSGMTFCVGNVAIVSVLRPTPNLEHRIGTAVHESIHRRQIRRVGCAEANRRYSNDEGYRIASEAEAYCGEPFAYFFAENALRNHMLNVLATTDTATVVSEIAKFCP